MQFGMIGLGRMGFSLVRRVTLAGYHCVAYDVDAAIDEAVPVPVLSAVLFERFSSRGEGDFANRVLSAMRKEFGGHDEKTPDK